MTTRIRIYPNRSDSIVGDRQSPLHVSDCYRHGLWETGRTHGCAPTRSDYPIHRL
ncbi:hypothetical protein [Xanthocytophaga flava]|uniref:hypothetical protein n=1 Tax=Xanthocytophaga flava TaxID=3048013 RepID=UPI0028D2F993|nr:hypothetical protein [Xanthocytophaga flavus]MDJ1470843.1 hypothetical protein [Xanthocytophaga flavus]